MEYYIDMSRFQITLMVIGGLALVGAAVFGAVVAGQSVHTASHIMGCFAADSKGVDCPPGTFAYWNFHVEALRGFSTATLVVALILAFAAIYLDLAAALMSRLRQRVILPRIFSEIVLEPRLAYSSELRWTALHEGRPDASF